MIPEYQNRKIAYAALNWGLGHLTRSLSILKKLQSQNEVFFLGNPDQIQFLKEEKLALHYLEFPDYNLNFSGKSFLVEMIFNSPRMIQAIQIEGKKLEELQHEHQFDLILSDNRFGFRLDQVESNIVTHQLNIKSPVFEKQGSKLNQIYLNKFDQIWVPDHPNHHFSGELSKATLQKPVHFLGNISDLEYDEREKKLDFFVIGSGPEPYRSKFLQKVYKRLVEIGRPALITGLPNFKSEYDHIQITEKLNRSEIQQHILEAEWVISKAGYTTLLDLEKCKAKAYLFPTKTQYEQEYLAKHLKTHSDFHFLEEKDLHTIG